MSYKKFFSNNNNTSYNDFLKIKKGREMIKKEISNKKHNLNKFINYETFLILTKTFYDNLNNRYKFSAPVSISNSNTSFLNYKSIINHLHNDDCDYCKKCPMEEIVNCKYVSNILYPYGESIMKNDPLENIYFPHNIDLNLYCRKCPFPCVEKCETIYYKSCDRGCGKSCGKSCNGWCGKSCNGWCGKSCDKGCEKYGDGWCRNSCDRGCRNSCDRGCGNSFDGGSCDNECFDTCIWEDRDYYDKKCGKTSPLFFKEKVVCRCPKSSKCEKCNH
jgi:hypothetical protein